MSRPKSMWTLFLCLMYFLTNGMTSLQAKEESITIAKPPLREYVLLNHPEYHTGMFGILSTVLGFLHHYEIGYFAGLKVDFTNQGLYYDAAKGSNWWEYYFEPLEVGTPDLVNVKIYTSASACSYHALFSENHLSREYAYSLIQKYMKLKPSIHQKLIDFVEQQFQGHFIIGVHYRGTDKIAEAPPISYEVVAQAILNQVQLLQRWDFKIFVATDEQKFLDYINACFPGRVICQEAYRSQTGFPIHYTPTSRPYQMGEEALLDCLLLSQTHFLIRTSSNLSLWSSYFNPFIPVISLNKRY